MEAQAPSPQTTLLILLGASAWPFSPEFSSSPAFANAARILRAYFLNPRLFGLPAENLLDLFDSDKSADELDVEISQFLERRLIDMKKAGNAGRDLLLYFIGHGGFVGHDSDFYLAIRRTRMDSPRASGMQMLSLADTLTERARHLRRIIILDCSFAAAASSAFEAGPDQVAIEKTVDAFQVRYKAVVGFPTKGTTLLCSSSHKSPSLLLPDGSSTMFTKAFLDALIQGTPPPRDHLTLRDVKDLVADLLSETRNAPRPVVFSPDQSEGDVADIPFFPNPAVPKDPNRQRMLEKVRTSWITGLLEPSLHGEALITLRLGEQPDAVANPWGLVLQQSDQSTLLLPPTTSIAQVYTEAAGELLILGESGSGKTTLLLELARYLLDRAAEDENLPMPVVFNLSSWAVKRQSLPDWLMEELNSKYQILRKLAQSWVDNNRILPLLDGLDEVTPIHLAACVDAINIYRQERGSSKGESSVALPTVVCSRTADYLSQTKRLLLRSAVVVQPLTADQVDNSLASAGKEMEAARIAIHNDSVLRELAATPLMLSILTLGYYEKSFDNLSATVSPEKQRQQVLAAYVERVLQRRGANIRYTPQQTIYWLAWLARQLVRHHQVTFSIELVQPDWLSESQLHQLSRSPAAKLVFRGNSYVKQIVLRLLLWRAGDMPWNYSGFLDYAAERVLLNKVGKGSYTFINRLLLEYFAELDTASAPYEAVGQTM